MTGWTRREVLRRGAGVAVVAVPMAVLAAGAAGASSGTGTGTGLELGGTERAALGNGPVMFSVRDASRGEVAIYHGRREVIVRDRALVARIVQAATAAGTD